MKKYKRSNVKAFSNLMHFYIWLVIEFDISTYKSTIKADTEEESIENKAYESNSLFLLLFTILSPNKDLILQIFISFFTFRRRCPARSNFRTILKYIFQKCRKYHFLYPSHPFSHVNVRLNQCS